MSEWIEWHGGEWNGDPDAQVTVRVRCGQEETGTARCVVATWRRSTEPGAQHRENYDVTHYRLVETQQATEPVAQARQHVSQAAAEVLAKAGGSSYEEWSRSKGVVMLTVAEHDALLAEAEEAAKVIAHQDTHIAVLENEIERLRKGPDENATRNNEKVRVEIPEESTSAQNHNAGALMRASLLSAAAPLDHRLGTRLPDGEPCEPMSSYSWKRGLG